MAQRLRSNSTETAREGRPTAHARNIRHPCRNALVGGAGGSGVGTMIDGPTLVCSVRGGVGHATCWAFFVLGGLMAFRSRSQGDQVGSRISLKTALAILTGYSLVFGVDRWAKLDGFAILMFGGFLTLSGMASNRMPVFVLGLFTTVLAFVINVLF